MQSSNVRLTTRRLVKYTTTRFSAPGSGIDGSDCVSGWSEIETLGLGSGEGEGEGSGAGAGLDSRGSVGRVDQARRSELASRTLWKTVGFLWVETAG